MPSAKRTPNAFIHIDPLSRNPGSIYFLILLYVDKLCPDQARGTQTVIITYSSTKRGIVHQKEAVSVQFACKQVPQRAGVQRSYE